MDEAIINPDELQRMADMGDLLYVRWEVDEALRKAAREILRQRNYIDQLQAIIDAS